MAAARDRTKSAVAAVRALRRAAPVGVAGCVLVAGVLLLGNPFAASPAPVPRAPQPEIRLGTAELSLPEPAASPAHVPAPPKPAAVQAAPAAAIPPAPRPRQVGRGKRATIIVETLPAKPIIPPFVPKEPAGATPPPHPPLPLDTEIGKTGSTQPTPKPAPKTAAASLPRDG